MVVGRREVERWVVVDGAGEVVDDITGVLGASVVVGAWVWTIGIGEGVVGGTGKTDFKKTLARTGGSERMALLLTSVGGK